MLGGAGIVHQHVELAVGRGGGGDLVTHVALHQLGLGAGRLHCLGRRLGLLAALGVIEEQGLRAALGRANGDGCPQPRPAARHQDHLVVELSHARLPWVSDPAGLTPSRYAAVR